MRLLLHLVQGAISILTDQWTKVAAWSHPGLNHWFRSHSAISMDANDLGDDGFSTVVRAAGPCGSFMQFLQHHCMPAYILT